MKLELTNKIREILLESWDPLSVGDNPHLSDEYDSYLSWFVSAVENQYSIGDIYNKLSEIEKNNLCSTTSHEKKLTAAQRLFAIRLCF